MTEYTLFMILKELTYLFDIVNPKEGNWKNISMCELGNQIWISRRSAKRVFRRRKIKEHVSIDLNGKNGAKRLDLQKELPYHNYFDITTDFGTIEHVKKQYEVFKNVHDITKIGGYIIHTLPLYGDWPNHCNWYYKPKFFRKMARLSQYDIVHFEIAPVKLKHHNINRMIAIIYRKTKDEWITREQFERISGITYQETTRVYN